MAERKFELVNGSFSKAQSPQPIDTGGGGPHDPDMEKRIEKLEKLSEEVRERLLKVELKLDNCATKADLAENKALIAESKAAISEAKSSIILWVVGAVILAQFVPSLPAIISAVGKLFGK